MEEMEKKAGSAEQVSMEEQKSKTVNYEGKGVAPGGHIGLFAVCSACLHIVTALKMDSPQ